MTDPYLPIADYGAIGNLRTVALVGRNGSIDWYPLPELDSPTVFAAILDRRRGGRFRIAPLGVMSGEQRYLDGTNVLETTFQTPDGTLTVTDFMPLSGDIEGRGASHAPAEIHRLLTVHGGPVDVELEWAPRPDYARARAVVERVAGGFRAAMADADGGELLLTGVGGDGEVREDETGPTVHVRLHLSDGERRAIVLRAGSGAAPVELQETLEAVRQTVTAWRGWVHRDSASADRSWAGEWADLIVRSELVLKLLVFAESGAIAAAATSSLPESIGGVRNWDYRFTWIRDASLTAQALVALGHGREAHDFLNWAERVSESGQRAGHGLRVMYGLRGETDLTEEALKHLEGYRGSRPVRVGNGAAEQRQLDIYGELLDGAYELARSGGELPAHLRGFLRRLADDACAVLDQPDSGIWEIRGPERHFVYSKLMVWVALDRAIQLAHDFGLEEDVERWRVSRARAREMVLERGFDREVGAFVQAFDSTELDASNLLIPLHELLPFEDRRVQATVDRTLERLTDEGLVYRYRMDDGLPGEEGAFVLCSFWLIDALALSGRVAEARDLFDRLASRANHLGLYPEQIDPRTGAFLGNFPQAFSHIGLINSALYLAYAEGRKSPVPAPIGSQEHREEVHADRTAPIAGQVGGQAK